MPDSKFAGHWTSGKSTLPDIRQRAAARWLPTTDLQQRDFAILFEDAFRGKSRKIFRFCSLKFIQKKLPKYRVKTVHFLKSIDGTDNGTKKYRVTVPRYFCTAVPRYFCTFVPLYRGTFVPVLLYRGTAQLCTYVVILLSLFHKNNNYSKYVVDL